MSNDTSLWNTTASQNLMLSNLTTFDSSTTGSVVESNALLSWGTNTQSAPDRASFKSAGLLCVKGNFYLNTRRFLNTGDAFNNGQTIKSHDHGASWSPTPPGQNQPYTSPMFPGYVIPSGFVQYGQCYSGSGPDNSAKYVYAGVYDTAPSHWSSLYLARVPISAIDNLNAADWSYYQGGSGMNNANWGALSTAAKIIDATAYAGFSNVGLCCGNAIQYLPRYRQYLYVGTRDLMPSHNHSVLSAFAGPHPWGPFTIYGQFSSSPVGENWTEPMPMSVVNGGQQLTMAASGNYLSCCDPNDPNNYYTLMLHTLTIN
jgi:hypothetical protein